jgi:MerR family transcriptional regulator/heat shock protein HspR
MIDKPRTIQEPQYRQTSVGPSFYRLSTRPKAQTVDTSSHSESHNASLSAHSTPVEGVYIISVAARILQMHPQTLRKYERLGLIQPSRTVGMLRLYSEEDLAKLRLIKYLENDLGMNLAGVTFTLNLLEQLIELENRLLGQTQVRIRNNYIEHEIQQLFQRLNLPYEIIMR